jgi:arsenate reductase (glutaredoxin)
MEVTIHHNPRCGTSRRTLDLIRQAGIEPRVVEYLHTPPSQGQLRRLLQQAGLRPRDALRAKEAAYAELGLDDPSMSDEDLLSAMVEHPILMERPIVESPLGVRLCRPAERVLEILPPGSG